MSAKVLTDDDYKRMVTDLAREVVAASVDRREQVFEGFFYDICKRIIAKAKEGENRLQMGSGYGAHEVARLKILLAPHFVVTPGSEQECYRERQTLSGFTVEWDL